MLFRSVPTPGCVPDRIQNQTARIHDTTNQPTKPPDPAPTLQEHCRIRNRSQRPGHEHTTHGNYAEKTHRQDLPNTKGHFTQAAYPLQLPHSSPATYPQPTRNLPTTPSRKVTPRPFQTPEFSPRTHPANEEQKSSRNTRQEGLVAETTKGAQQQTAVSGFRPPVDAYQNVHFPQQNIHLQPSVNTR